MKCSSCVNFLLIFFAVIGISTKSKADEAWSFIALADWHGGEPFALYPGESSETWIKSLETLTYIKQNYGGDSIELIILPGDTNNGKWDEQEFIKKLDPSLLPQQAVLTAGRNCYSTMKKLFSSAGFETMLVAVGDHELGGNAWRSGSSKVLSLPQYRQGFMENFNRDESGEFLFPERIGTAVSRPRGTIHENTSFAFRNKNALFITIDAFHSVDDSNSQTYLDRENGVGGEGIVTGTLDRNHLIWFQSILEEARKDDTIKHIFVQSHLPVIQPVRKVSCSGQFMDYGEESDFWRLMNEYGVDVYFAGEVHANTVTKSEDSNLVQVVSRGNMFNNFLKIEVNDDQIVIISYNEIGNNRVWNNNHVEHGRLTIDKSSSTTKMLSDGSLQILDRNLPLIHITFEEVFLLQDRQVLGMVHDDSEDKLVGTSITMRGVKCTQSLPNLGGFGQQFDAQVANLDFLEGKVGEFSGFFTNQSRLAIYGTGPNSGGNIISVSLWIKTVKSVPEMILFHYGSVFGDQTKSSKDLFTLTLDNGKPKLYTNLERYLTTSEDINLDDGKWHHIAVTMPRKNCLLAEVKIYVDGNRIATIGPALDKHIFVTTSGRLSFGSFGFSSDAYDDALSWMVPYSGSMDDIKVWARPLKRKELPSNQNKFAISNGFQCNRQGMKKVIIRGKIKKCKNRCAKDETCLGFEWRNVPQGKGKPKCFLLKEKPTIGPSRDKTKCAIKK